MQEKIYIYMRLIPVKYSPVSIYSLHSCPLSLVVSVHLPPASTFLPAALEHGETRASECGENISVHFIKVTLCSPCLIFFPTSFLSSLLDLLLLLFFFSSSPHSLAGVYASRFLFSFLYLSCLVSLFLLFFVLLCSSLPLLVVSSCFVVVVDVVSVLV